MTRTLLMSLLAVAVASSAACKKSGGTGGGGGGGGWLVGSSGLMANTDPSGHLGAGYDLGASENLYAIACRHAGEAFVVGGHGTVLYTGDGGETWLALGGAGDHTLRALATQDAGPVYVAGEGTLLRSLDAGDHWTELSDGATRFTSVAAAQRGTTVLAISDDGGLWAYDGIDLARRATLAGARAVAVSPDGANVIVAGNGVQISHDGGATFAPIAVAGAFESARIDDRGEAIAVGAHGTIANISANDTALVQHVGTADLHVVHMQTWGAGTSRGYLAGEDGQVYLTTDAGWSWTVGPRLAGAVYGADEIGAGHN